MISSDFGLWPGALNRVIYSMPWPQKSSTENRSRRRCAHSLKSRDRIARRRAACAPASPRSSPGTIPPRASTCATRRAPARKPACARKSTSCRKTFPKARCSSASRALNADPRGARHPGAAAAAAAARCRSRPRRRLAGEGRGRLPRRQPGRAGAGAARLRARHAGRRDAPARARRGAARRQAGGDRRPLEHRRQAARAAALAKRRDRHHLPFADPRTSPR